MTNINVFYFFTKGYCSFAGGPKAAFHDNLQKTITEYPLHPDERRAHIYMHMYNDNVSDSETESNNPNSEDVGMLGRRVNACITWTSNNAIPDVADVEEHNFPDVFLVLYDLKLVTRIGRNNNLKINNINNMKGNLNNKNKNAVLDEMNVVRHLERIQPFWSKTNKIKAVHDNKDGHKMGSHIMEVSFTMPEQNDGCCLLLQKPYNGSIVASAYMEPGNIKRT